MGNEVDNKRFKLTVTKVALCVILWQLASIIFNVMCNAVLNIATGSAIGPFTSTIITVFVTESLSLLVVFPLLGRLLHISLRSLWVGAKVDTRNMRFYVPVSCTVSAVGAYLITLPLFYLFQLIGVQSTPMILTGYNGPLPLMVLLVVFTVFIGPLTEEVFTRGILLHILAPFGKGFAMVTTALLFSLGHSNFSQLFTTFLFGLVMTYITLETGTIKNAFILHAFNNGVTVVGQIIGFTTPQGGLAFIISTYVILGCTGIWILIKKRRVIHESLHNELPEFIPIEHRVRKFVCTPLMLLTLIVSVIILFDSIRAI